MSKTTVTIDGKPVAVGTAAAFQNLAAAFKKQFGLTLHVRSGLRTRAEQQRLYDLYKAGKGNLAARPGTSRHESGKALDVFDSGRDAGVTRLGSTRAKWLRSNAAKYGFTANGYGFRQVEPWHIEFTGNQWKAPKPKAPTRPTPGSPWFALGSWNISGGNKTGVKTWTKRRDLVLAKIKASGHEVICLQEAYPSTSAGDPMLTWLIENLPDCTVAVTRSGRAILVRDGVKVIASGMFDLKTKAPGHPKKYATWVHIHVNGYHALIVNAHAQNGALWSSVRRKWANELAAEVEQLHVKRGILRTNVFLAGDWNGREAAEVFAKRGWVDAASQSAKTHNQVFKTLNSWKRGLKTGPRIDYILAPIGRPLADVRQHDDSQRADHNYQTALINHYRKI